MDGKRGGELFRGRRPELGKDDAGGIE